MYFFSFNKHYWLHCSPHEALHQGDNKEINQQLYVK